jgi:hypothetical protein
MSGHLEGHATLCAGYAIGCLDDRERSNLAGHLLTRCAPCTAALEEDRAAVRILARSAPRSTPGRGLRARVLADALLAIEAHAAQIDAGSRSLEVRSSPMLTWQGWGFLYLALVLGMLALAAWGDARSTRAELAATRSLMTRLSQTYALETRWNDAMFSPRTRAVVLQPPAGAARGAQGHVSFDPASGRTVLFVRGLQPGRGDVVLWGARAAGWRRLSPVTLDANGAALLRLEHAADPTLTGFALSLEPPGAGGATAPAGALLLQGELAR